MDGPLCSPGRSSPRELTEAARRLCRDPPDHGSPTHQGRSPVAKEEDQGSKPAFPGLREMRFWPSMGSRTSLDHPIVSGSSTTRTISYWSYWDIRSPRIPPRRGSRNPSPSPSRSRRSDSTTSRAGPSPSGSPGTSTGPDQHHHLGPATAERMVTSVTYRRGPARQTDPGRQNRGHRMPPASGRPEQPVPAAPSGQNSVTSTALGFRSIQTAIRTFPIVWRVSSRSVVRERLARGLLAPPEGPLHSPPGWNRDAPPTHLRFPPGPRSAPAATRNMTPRKPSRVFELRPDFRPPPGAGTRFPPHEKEG